MKKTGIADADGSISQPAAYINSAGLKQRVYAAGVSTLGLRPAIESNKNKRQEVGIHRQIFGGVLTEL